ncbi:tail fiber protein, partial [Escherichia coli]|nr:tail fiber protein [Escherichia coli]
KRLQKDQNGADIPDKDRFLSNINVYSKGEVDQKKGMRYVVVNAPAGVQEGKYYPLVIKRNDSHRASRVVISTPSRSANHRMNNCEFNGFVCAGGWTDRGSYACGMFWAYSSSERAIHSILMSNKGDTVDSVFYIEGGAFPVEVFLEEGLSVTAPASDYVVAETTYKFGATDPLSESTNAQIILDFKNGRGYYCSHPFISSLSGNAATATKLQTACTINGVSFDGTKDITLTPKDLDAYSKSEVQSALAGKQPLDNTLTNLSGKDVAGLLAYLGLGEGSALPVGVPVPWPSATPPTGWLKCNGAAFSAEEYPELAKAYPTNKLPDLRGEFIRGWDDSRGIDNGRALLSSQGHSLRDHSHNQQIWTGSNTTSSTIGQAGNYAPLATGGDGGIAYTDREPQSLPSAVRAVSTRGVASDNAANIGTETRPRNIAFNYIVRAA